MMQADSKMPDSESVILQEALRDIDTVKRTLSYAAINLRMLEALLKARDMKKKEGQQS